MTGKGRDLSRGAGHEDVTAFLAEVAAAPPPARRGARRGRLLFAMDATASREPTWDRACQIQGEMFHTTAALGGLDVQLCYYRGFHEFNATPWLADARALARHMTAVRCAAGATQIGRTLEHTLAQTRSRKVDALVFVGDAMEEDPDALCARAGELGLQGVPVFVFHEGGDAAAGRTFRAIARLSGGACCRFDPGSAEQLRQLLAAVAVFAAGGRRALEDLGRREHGVVRQLVQQLE
jgi:hypothetical protein